MIAYRDEKGRVVKGSKQPKEISKAISRTKRKRVRELAHKGHIGYVPDIKVCPQCKKPKLVATEYTLRKKTLKSGIRVTYPNSECRECKNIKTAKWRDKKRREGVLPEMQKQWNKSRDPEKTRRYWREYQAIQRRKAGMKVVGPWIRYRESAREDSIPIEPLGDFIKQQKEEKDISINEMARRAGVDSKRIRQIIKPVDQHRVTSDFAERIIKAVDPDIHLSEVYPALYD